MLNQYAEENKKGCRYHPQANIECDDVLWQSTLAKYTINLYDNHSIPKRDKNVLELPIFWGFPEPLSTSGINSIFLLI